MFQVSRWGPKARLNSECIYPSEATSRGHQRKQRSLEIIATTTTNRIGCDYRWVNDIAASRCFFLTKLFVFLIH